MRSLVCPMPLPDYPVSKPLTGAFIVGLIVPRQGNLAIALTEKLEDAVSIIFLPLVCLPKPSRFDVELTYLTVLHAFWPLDRSRPTQLWDHLGLHNRHLRYGLRWQVRWMLHRSTIRRVQLARIHNHRDVDELQRVRSSLR